MRRALLFPTHSAPSSPHTRVLAFSVAALSLLMVSCDETVGGLDDDDPVPAAMEVVGGDSQTGEVGTELAEALAVRILTDAGEPVPGVPVGWTTPDGGSVAASSTTTDSTGTARAAWTLGTAPGAQEAEASAANVLTATFTATAEAGPLDALTVSEDSLAFVAVDDTGALAVTGADRYGNDVPVSGVSWAVRDTAVATVDGSGTVTAVANGATHVVAAVDGVADSAGVRVDQVVTSIDVPGPDTLTAVDDSVELSATPQDGNGHEVNDAGVVWTSSDTTVAAVRSGWALARGDGQATLTATAGDVSANWTLVVAQTPTAVTIFPDSVSFGAFGATGTLEVTATDANGNAVDVTPTFVSRDSSVVTVDAAGTITTVANGVTDVVGTAAGMSDSARVVVSQVVLIIDIPANDTLTALGDSLELAATPRDGGGSEVAGATVSWSSSDTTVVAVSSGWAVARGNGVATLTAASGDATDSFTIRVAVEAATLTASPDSMTFAALGDADTIQVSATDGNGNGVSILPDYTSDDPAVATVDTAGIVTAAGDGATRIVVSAGAAADTVHVTVSRPIARVAVSPAVDTIASGSSLTLTATAYDANDSTIAASFAWTSSDTAVATVDSTGTVAAGQVGSAQIVATTGSLADTAAITVVAGAAASLTKQAGDGQSGASGLTLADSLVVSLADANGNPVVGEDVVWSTADGGTLSPDTVATATAGLAAAAWTPGDTTGTQTATATAAGLTATFSATITTVPADSVNVTPDSAGVSALGDTVQYSAALFDSTGGTLSAEAAWSSSDTAVATVDTTGLATAVATGSAWIRAESGSVADSSILTVTQALDAVTVTPAADTLFLGGSTMFAAEGADANGNAIAGLTFAWSTLDTGVATVDGSGTVSAAGVGTTSVVAESGGLADTAVVVVETAVPDSILIVAGDSQAAQVGEVLPDSIVVQVLDSAGAGILGVPVVRAAGTAHGTLSPDTAVTDSAGRSAFTWTLPNSTGTYSLYLGPAGTSLSVTVTATAVTADVAAACTATGTPHSGTLSADETWAAAGSPHHVSGGNVLVTSGATLTIEAGVTVCMGADRSMTFDNGANLVAVGTAASPILFTPADGIALWSGLTFMDAAFDTTRITNATIEWAEVGSGAALYSRDTHPVLLDSVVVRQTRGAVGVRLGGAGSAIYRSRVDTVQGGVASYSSGIFLETSATVEDVTVLGSDGPGVYFNGNAGARLRRVHVEGSASYGFEVGSAGAVAEATGNRSVNNAYPARMGADALALFAPTPADQDSLIGNVTDTLFLDHGGAAQNAHLRIRPDLPWNIVGSVTIGSGSVLEIPAGTAVQGSGHITFQNGGYLDAQGTAALPITWSPGRLRFEDAPADTSRLRHAVLDGGRRILALDQHVLEIDSVEVLNSITTSPAVDLTSPGSSIRHSTIQSSAGDGLRLWGPSLTVQSVTIQGAGRYGLEARGATTGLVLEDVRVLNSADIGLLTGQGTRLASASGIRVAQGASYPASLGSHTIGVIAGDAAAQDSLMGNASDTLLVAGGMVTHDTILARPELPWIVDYRVYVDTSAVMIAKPGVSILSGDDDFFEFRNGGRLEALGTAGSPITFTARDTAAGWSGLEFTGTAGDSSVVKHAVVERAEGIGHIGFSNSPNPAITTKAKLVLEDVVIRQSGEEGLRLEGAGSRATRVAIDTTRSYQTGDIGQLSAALVVGHEGVTVAQSVVREAAGNGLSVTAPTADTVWARVSGSGLYGVTTLFNALASLPPQDSLVGNGRDTIKVYSGGDRMTRDTRVASLLPIEVVDGFRCNACTLSIDSGAVWMLDPGARIVSDNDVQYDFLNGGRLDSRGTAASPVVFSTLKPDHRWYGLRFAGSPADSSYVIHTVVEEADGTSPHLTAVAAVLRSSDAHPLVIDSSRIRRAGAVAVALEGPGSRITNTIIDTTRVAPSTGSGNDHAAALMVLDSAVTVHSVTVRNPAGAGLGMRMATTDTVGIRVLEANGYSARITHEALTRLPALDSLSSGGADTVVMLGFKSVIRENTSIGSAVPFRMQRTSGNTSSRLVVDSAVTLTIEPGASIRMYPDGLLIDEGTLIAEGTASAPILFTGDPAAPGGAGIGIKPTFDAASATCIYPDTSRLKHVIIQHLGNQTVDDDCRTASSGSYAGALATNVPTVVDSSVVRQVAGNGIAGPAVVLNSVVDSVGGHGLVNVDSVRHTLVRASGGYGIYADMNSPDIHDSEILDNQDIGIYVDTREFYGTGLTVSNSNIVNNNLSDTTRIGLVGYNGADTVYHTVVGENNWWGHANGPDDPNADSANGVGVTYSPWLTAPITSLWYKPSWP